MHGHGHHAGGPGHSHGVVDPVIATTSRGIWAIKWSFAGLGATAIAQFVVFLLSGSVALFADTVHNVADAFTAVPLWIAFLFARKPPSKRFAYGLGRVEDLAGAVVVLVILGSALVAGYESIERLIHPQDVHFVWVVATAGVVGFIGNEAVAVFRIRIGREINSAALVADGYHARVDGLTSLGVLGGAMAVWLGFPIADPIVGLVVSIIILRIVWQSGKAVFTRMLDGVDPGIVDEIVHEAGHVGGVVGVSEVRSRWLGHRLEVEAHITVRPDATIEEAHRIGGDVSHRLSHAIPYIGSTTVHIDPTGMAGASYHRGFRHEHDNLSPHAH